MSSPIAIPRSSKASSYASAVASSPTMSVTMGSPSSSPRSAGVYVPVHRRPSPASPSTPSRALPSESASSTSHQHPFTYTPSFLLTLRNSPSSSAQTSLMKSKIRECAASPEVADMVLMNRRMRKGLEFRKKRESSGSAVESLAPAPVVQPSTTVTTTTVTTPISLLHSTPQPKPTTTVTTTPSKSTLSRNPPRRTRSSSTRTSRPPRQMLRLSRNAARVMNARESWRGSSSIATSTISVA